MFSTDAIYEIISFSVGETKSKAKMGKLMLKNLEDETCLNCVLWEETLNRYSLKVFRSGNKIRIITASFNEKFNNCLIQTVELVEEGLTGLTEEQTQEYYDELTSYIEKIEDEKIKNFVKNIINENSEQFKIAPAGKAMHHNYLGGLLVHTVECLRLSDKICEVSFQKINKDELYAACVLHDIGKIFEYVIDDENDLINYNEQFRKDWVSHTQYAFSICMTQDFKRIAKMIAAHHSRAEWGAIIDLNEKELEPYVYVLHHIDDLSAKFGRINTSMLK